MRDAGQLQSSLELLLGEGTRRPRGPQRQERGAETALPVSTSSAFPSAIPRPPHSGEFLSITFSACNFKYGTAMTPRIQTPGSFPPEYEKFIIFPTSHISIFTVTMNIRTYCKHTHKSKNRNKIHPVKKKNPKIKKPNLST